MTQDNANNFDNANNANNTNNANSFNNANDANKADEWLMMLMNDADEWCWWMMLMNDAWVKQEPHDRSVLLIFSLTSENCPSVTLVQSRKWVILKINPRIIIESKKIKKFKASLKRWQWK